MKVPMRVHKKFLAFPGGRVGRDKPVLSLVEGAGGRSQQRLDLPAPETLRLFRPTSCRPWLRQSQSSLGHGLSTD